MPGKAGPLSQRGLTLQVLLLIVLPITLLLIVIAIGSIAVHQQVMRSELPGDAQLDPSDVALDLTLLAPLVLIAPLLFAFAALWFSARRIVQPLQQLESKAAAVAAGDFEAIHESVGGISAVQQLQAALADMAAKVHASQAGLRDYIGAITSAQEEERLRLARDLHDDTIQELIALKQRLQLAQKAASSPASAGLLTELEQMAEDTIANVRRMTRALRPIYLEDLGLVTALEMLARETSQPQGTQVDFRCSGRQRRLTPEAELALYRIAQQALNNVLRHAAASHASLSVDFREAEVRLTVADDGIGFQKPFAPTDLASDGHFGLLGMRERADLIGAQLEVRTEPGRGTTILVELPLGADLARRADLPA